MTARATLILPLVAFFMASAPAAADPLADAVGTIPAGVEDVRIVGSWSGDDGAGLYRVVVTRSDQPPVTARLFVQWIALGGPDGASVQHSIEIAELAEAKVDVADLNAEIESDGTLAVYIHAIDAAADREQTYELFITAPDDYRFAPATN